MDQPGLGQQRAVHFFRGLDDPDNNRQGFIIMPRSTLRRGGACAAALLTLALGLTAAGPAQADPGSATGFAMTIGVDDTTPVPGQTITVTFDYTIPGADSSGTAATWGFGDSLTGTKPVNLGDLAYVANSCTGDISGCTYNPAAARAFSGAAPVGAVGTKLHGSAQFTVSAGATVGEQIKFYGFHRMSDGFMATNGTPVLTLTVEAAPEADLGVSLTAASALLSSQVNYDVAVTNNGPGAASSATITTQLPTQVTSATSATCTYAAATDRVTCPIGALANGATTHATFTASYGLLTLGSGLHAQATRTASTPNDPNPANDSDGADCTALTSLIISC